MTAATIADAIENVLDTVATDEVLHVGRIISEVRASASPNDLSDDELTEMVALHALARGHSLASDREEDPPMNDNMIGSPD